MEELHCYYDINPSRGDEFNGYPSWMDGIHPDGVSLSLELLYIFSRAGTVLMYNPSDVC